MNVRVRLFARARDLAGAESVQLDLPESPTVGQLRAVLLAKCPALEPIGRSLLVAVGNDYARDDTLLADSAEIAVFPPVSGG